MSGAERAIRWSTVAAVSVVALVAAFVSYRHALQVVSQHGESGALAKAYPLTIDGLIYAASMVLLDAARRSVRAHWLAYAALGLGVAATLAANVAAGLAYGPVGAVVAAWPAPALVISYELLMLVIRGSVATSQETDGGTIGFPPALAQVAPDAESAARLALAASVAAGNPISQRQLMTRFGLTRTAERKVRQAVAAQANGHGTG